MICVPFAGALPLIASPGLWNPALPPQAGQSSVSIFFNISLRFNQSNRYLPGDTAHPAFLFYI